MRKQYFSFIFLYIFSSCLYSQTMDDNIIINCCEDSYVFKEGPGNNPIVQNTRKTEYEASRMGATVQPHMFYGEFISLDEARAKGVLAPKPSTAMPHRKMYSSMIPASATSTSP